jgi:uroporphyrinogen-III decarboxylase
MFIMSHITADRIRDSWKELEKAEQLVETNSSKNAVLKCESVLQDLYRAASGMGFELWFTRKEEPIRKEIQEIKKVTNPEEEIVYSVIEDIKSLTRNTKQKVIPELNSRIEYTVSVELPN